MFETARLVEVLETLRVFKFSPRRMRFVYPNRRKPSHVFFVESVLGGKGKNLKVEQPIYSTPSG
jgi:tRNA1(Val) A37 N6-methylase TrmN6